MSFKMVFESDAYSDIGNRSNMPFFGSNAAKEGKISCGMNTINFIPIFGEKVVLSYEYIKPNFEYTVLLSRWEAHIVRQGYEKSITCPGASVAGETLPIALGKAPWYGSGTFVGRHKHFTIKQEEQTILDLAPVLDADGTPCMFDKISRTCFYNAGSGSFGYRVKTTGATSAPMSLRDPYYTAPSGIYARPSGENQLEILADTEAPPVDGWEWFANTGEAYEHFGIKQEELLTTAQTND